MICKFCGGQIHHDGERWYHSVDADLFRCGRPPEPDHITAQEQPMAGVKPVLPAVIDDLRARAVAGKRKYGTFLEAGNGRDALIDAYQEACDLVMYLKQALMEREDEKKNG